MSKTLFTGVDTDQEKVVPARSTTKLGLYSDICLRKITPGNQEQPVGQSNMLSCYAACLPTSSVSGSDWIATQDAFRGHVWVGPQLCLWCIAVNPFLSLLYPLENGHGTNVSILTICKHMNTNNYAFCIFLILSFRYLCSYVGGRLIIRYKDDLRLMIILFILLRQICYIRSSDDYIVETI